MKVKLCKKCGVEKPATKDRCRKNEKTSRSNRTNSKEIEVKKLNEISLKTLAKRQAKVYFKLKEADYIPTTDLAKEVIAINKELDRRTKEYLNPMKEQ